MSLFTAVAPRLARSFVALFLLASVAWAQPQLEVSPATLAPSLGPGTTTEQYLTVTNIGVEALTFTAARGPATDPAGGPDEFGYTWTDSDQPGGPVYQWVDIRDSGTLHPLPGTGEVWVDLPFNFPFYGDAYDEVKVYADGLISFLPTYQGTPSNNRPIPYWDNPDLFIAGFWDDLDPGRAGEVYTGTDARGRFVVQYQDVAPAGSGDGRYTFQIILDPTGTITIQYGPMTGPTDGATVGIENATSVHGGSTTGLQVAYDEPYVYDGLAVRIAEGDPWFWVDPAEHTLAPGASTELPVTFSSYNLTAGALTSSLVLTSDALDAPLDVPVQLTVLAEPNVEVSAGALDFGEVYLGAVAEDAVLVTNTGSAALTISSVGADGPPFEAAMSGTSTLAPGESRIVNVTFEPTAAGPSTGTLTVATDDPDEPSVSVALSGEGLPAPDIAVSPASLSVALMSGETTTRTLTIENGGASDLDFDLSFQPGPGGVLDSLYYDFGTETAGTTGWTPWQPFDVANRFTADGPFHLTAVRAFLDIENDPTVLFEVYGEGTFGDPTSGPLLWSRDVAIPHDGPAMYEVPLDTTLSFEDGEDFYIVIGTQEEFAPFGTHHSNGGRSYRRTFHGPTWHHEEGSATYVIRALQTLGAGLYAEPTAGTVAPGGEADVTVTFDASVLPGGEHTGAFVVASNDPDAPEVEVPVTFDVSGTPGIALTADSLGFGEVYLGDVATQTFHVRNLGTDVLTVEEITSSDDAFTVSPTGPLTLAPGARDTVEVTFTPPAAGPHEGTITVTSDDPAMPTLTVAVTGEGVDLPAISVSPDSLFVPVLSGDSTAVTVTLSNDGDGPLSFTLEGFTNDPPAGGPDAFGYTWTDSDQPGGPTFDWVDISGTGTALVLGDDDSEDVALPFPFPFYGDEKMLVRISSNGYLTFGNQRGDVWDARPIPHNWPPNDFIAPYWTNLDPDAGGTVYVGTDDLGRFVVQYDSVTTHSTPNWRSTFQVILDPGGNILFQYLSRSAPFSGTVGIENADATDGLEISHNEFPAYVRDSLAVRIDAPTPWLTVAPASGTVAPGESIDLTLTLDADTLEQSEYVAALRITSNDAAQPLLHVPVVMEVSGTLRIALGEGWNLVSWNVEPEDLAVEAVLADLLDRVLAVETYEGGERRSFVPGQSGNTLTTLMPTYGYWIKLAEPATLEIEGEPVDRQHELPLANGINAVSYLPWHASGVGHALESVMDVTTTAATFEGTGVTYASEVPAAFHVLDRMEPKAGYVIRTTAPGTLVYPATAGGHGPGSDERPTLEGRILAETEAGVRPTMAWMDVWGEGIELDDDPIPAGTRVTAVGEDGEPVGAFDVVAEGRVGLMAIYGDDPYTPEKDGAVPGETVTLRVGEAVLARFPWSMPGDVVDLSGVTVSNEDSDGTLPTELTLAQNYPNPFHPTTTIRYALPEPAHVRLVVYDALGRRVAALVDGEQPAGHHEAIWHANGVASGVYLYRIEAGDVVQSRRMVLMK